MMTSEHTDDEHTDVTNARDAGVTFFEVLIAIVLLGISVLATVTAVRLTVIGSATERDHARAHQWLQAATGAVQEAGYIPCDNLGSFSTAQQHMIDQYQTAIRSHITTNSIPPTEWSTSQIVVRAPIEVWDGNQYFSPAEAGESDPCFKDQGTTLQLITIEVRDTEGDIVESVQVVKDDS